ncbi:MAG: single-stranded DNA-binding protein [Lachnospiraceae bacterium]|nr:single-stranded DNA-binding protein [Lachnospiraceae bacterium]
MNRVILMGRLTRDPNISYSQSGDNMAIARFTLAVDRRGRRQDGAEQQTADFIGCVCFGRQAEFAEKYLRQGMKVAVSGRIQTGSYTDRNGQKVYTTDVVLDDIEFAESKTAEHRNGNTGYYGQEPQSDPGDGFMNIPDGIDEELPFN